MLTDRYIKQKEQQEHSKASRTENTKIKANTNTLWLKSREELVTNLQKWDKRSSQSTQLHSWPSNNSVGDANLPPSWNPRTASDSPEPNYYWPYCWPAAALSTQQLHRGCRVPYSYNSIRWRKQNTVNKTTRKRKHCIHCKNPHVRGPTQLKPALSQVTCTASTASAGSPPCKQTYCAMTSLPLIICLMARCWIAEGFSNPVKKNKNISPNHEASMFTTTRC